MFHNHHKEVFTQIIIGLIFIVIYYFVFSYVINKFNLKTPGREDSEEEIKMYTKEDYKNKNEKKEFTNDQAILIVDALGGVSNISDITNCATRLRVTVYDEKLVKDDKVFKNAGAHGVYRKGEAIQVIIGLSVQSVKSEIQLLLDNK